MTIHKICFGAEITKKTTKKTKKQHLLNTVSATLTHAESGYTLSLQTL